MTGPAFHGILFATAESERDTPVEEASDVFRDLQLDQIVDRATARFNDFDLNPFFHAPLRDADSIAYRQEVFRDLEEQRLMERVAAFTRTMHSMRADLGLAEQVRHRYERARWFVDAVLRYCEAVLRLVADLRSLEPRSRGLRGLREWLEAYVGSEAFRSLDADVRRLTSDLAAVRYTLRIHGGSVTVGSWEAESDYGGVIARLFERFTSEAQAETAQSPDPWTLDHVQARVVERVALLYPEVFERLEAFPASHGDYLDGTVTRFDRDVQFYMAYLSLIARVSESGPGFCYPQLCASARSVCLRDGFDLALALKLANEGRRVVTNGFRLDDPERVLVVTGPNHGGKTTFARLFGQVHWLARLGCPVPGAEARLALCDRVFTHFEREEELRTRRGKLHDELVRIRRILDAATSRSVVVMNEILSSTTLKDATCLGGRIMEEISRRDVLAICVTFLDELASFDEKTVSMVAGVDPEDPSVRTFRIERRPADGLAYALSVAEKYRVTHDWLARRIEA